MFYFLGTGKSKLIADISGLVEYLYRKNLDSDPDKPIVARASLTGIAASNINGHTLHSLLFLNFGNVFTSLGDEKRDNLRYIYSDLQLLIIDEISMVKPDLLYQVKSLSILSMLQILIDCFITDSFETRRNQAKSEPFWWNISANSWRSYAT